MAKETKVYRLRKAKDHKTSPITDEGVLVLRPGKLILQTIKDLGMTQPQLGQRLGKTAKMVNHLISGHTNLTVQTAIELQTVLGIEASVWIKLEMYFRARLTEDGHREQFAKSKKWLLQQPLDKLKETGILKSKKPDAKMIQECLQFYGVVSPQQWESVYIDKFIAARFRSKESYRKDLGNIAAWLRFGELRLQKLKCPVYDNTKFKKSLARIKSIAQGNATDFALQVSNICVESGVVVSYLAFSEEAPVNGAARWINGRPIIQITNGCKTYDHFWHTFFHLVAHILLHSRKEVFLEECKYFDTGKKHEDEANSWAGHELLPKPLIKRFAYPVTDEKIRRLGRRFKIDPGIMVTTLQNLDLIPKSVENIFKRNIYWDDVIKSTKT